MNASPRPLLCSALLLAVACGASTPAPSSPPGPASAAPSASAAPPVASVTAAPTVATAPSLRQPDPSVPLRPDAAPTPPGRLPSSSPTTDVGLMLGRLRGRFRSCFQRQLAVTPDLVSSPLRWELTVDREGHVTRGRYLCKAPLPPELQRCLEEALRTQVLEPGPRTITVGECAG